MYNSEMNKSIWENIKIELLGQIVHVLFFIESLMLEMRTYNYPKEERFILALWHSDQCALYSVSDRKKLNILISNSNDGRMIARCCELMGYSTIGGSSKRDGMSALLKMAEKLKNGENIAIMIDGPKGPKHKVKRGVVNLAKQSGVPIIPLAFESDQKSLVKLKTWDEFRFPVCFNKLVAYYGEP